MSRPRATTHPAAEDPSHRRPLTRRRWGTGLVALLTLSAPLLVGVQPALATLSPVPAVPAAPPPATPTITTTASPDVVLGGSISDTAVLSGGNNPTGILTFWVWGPDSPDCSLFPVAAMPAVVVVDGNGTYGPASFTPTATGTYRWTVDYSGDANNAPVRTPCGDPNETVTVTGGPPPLSLVTQASPGVAVGGTITDTATLADGIAPSGIIDFTLFGPDDATCAGPPAFTSPPVPVNGAGSYTSAPFAPTLAGTYRWVATYSNDPNNRPIVTACDDPAEMVVVTAPPPATPTITTTASPDVVLNPPALRSVAVAPVTGQPLARTGSEIAAIIPLAGGLLLAGVLMLIAVPRRSRHPARMR